VARIPAVKQQAHLTDGALGLALLGVPVGLLLGSVVAGRLIDRTGSARMARVAGTLVCVLFVTPGLAHNTAALIGSLLAIGVAGGTLGVAQNAQGILVETAYGRPIMSSLHAGYSLAAIAGSLLGGAFAWAGIGPAPALAAAGAPGAVVTVLAGRWHLRGRVSPPAGDTPRGPARQARVRSANNTGGGWALLAALGVLGICSLVGEGAAGDWSAVYLRDNLGTSAGFAALGYAAFSVTMTAGRLGGDRLVARFGAVRLVRVCGLVAAAGLGGGLASHEAYAGLAGFALLGAGLSVIVPQVFSAGGRADPARPGRGLAIVVGMGYTGMTGGPALIGMVADRIGLPLALGIPVLLALWVCAGATVLGRPGLSVSRAVHNPAEALVPPEPGASVQ
jgi:fucose permease